MSTKKLQIIDYSVKQAENADTLDGKHAVEFASASDVSDLQNKVGDTPVADQITSAVTNAGVLTIDITDAEAGTANLINADSLGGVAASEYALKADTAPNSEKLGNIAASEYALKTDTAPDSSKLGGKAPEYYLQPRNLLDNSAFWNPVNQRGAISYSGAVYSIDRWRSWQSDSVITLNDGYITHTQSLYQYVSVLDLNGTYTFAIGTKDGNTYCVTAMPRESKWENNLCITYDSNARVPYVVISPEKPDVVWAALYEGSYTAETLPPYVPKGYAAELAECQRYYLPVSDYWNMGVVLTGTGYICLDVPTNIKMRISPTTIISNPRMYHPTYDWVNLTYRTLERHAPFYRIIFDWPSNIQASISDIVLINGVTGLSADL